VVILGTLRCGYGDFPHHPLTGLLPIHEALGDGVGGQDLIPWEGWGERESETQRETETETERCPVQVVCVL